MKKTAFIFPGQGSQSVGMGRSFYEGFASSRKVYDDACEALGLDIKRLSFDGPQEELDLTENTQPALLTASIAAFRAFNEGAAITPSFMAGHSLGEYTALVAAGALSFKDAVSLVRLRGRFMQNSVPAGEGKMCAILGLDAASVYNICETVSNKDSVAVPANLNSPDQVVISGHTRAVDKAAEFAKASGAKRVIQLPVSVPSHSPLMEGASMKLSQELSGVSFNGFSSPVITNVEAKPVSNALTIRNILSRQLTNPVRWVDIIRRMKSEGVERVVEIGPGKVLTGLVKRIEKEIETFNVSEAADIEKTVEALKR